MVSVRKKPIISTVKDIKPVKLQMVRDTELEPLWDETARNYHYLGHVKMLGARRIYRRYIAGSDWFQISRSKNRMSGLFYRLVTGAKERTPFTDPMV